MVFTMRAFLFEVYMINYFFSLVINIFGTY